MTLTARLSLFSLGTLAAVLAGFSLAIYAVASTYLYRQADDRLDALLQTLEAAIESSKEGLEWEGAKRRLPAGPDADPEAFRWWVRADKGEVVGRSNPGAEEIERADEGAGAFVRRTFPRDGRTWRLGRHRLDHPGPVAAAARPEDGEPHYAVLELTAAVPLDPVAATLRRLALVLVGLSASIWMAAALAGRWLGRRALAPVTRMAASARAMRADDPGQRLPLAGTGDELDDLGRAFNDLLTRLHESFERQRRFTGDASHQLRTPLAAVLGQVEVALRRDRPGEDYRRTLGLVRGQVAHLARVVEALLFLARADAEADVPGLEPIDLGVWLNDHARAWAEQERGADLCVEIAAENSLKVVAHPALLGQLLDNLWDNARKYSEPGTPIGLSARAEGATVAVSVTDAGCGIDPGERVKVFEPFYRTASARGQGRRGVGLGLAVAQRIATALGATLDIEDHPGPGTRFTVRLRPAQPEVGVNGRP